MKQLFAILCLVLAACAHAAPPEPLASAPHWCAQERPAFVLVSDALDPACVEAVIDAVDFWRDQGVAYLSTLMVPDAKLTTDHPQPRMVQVITQLPDDPGASGDTRIQRITPDCIVAGQIRLAVCRKQTAAHELGHALGLGHVADFNNLMAEAVDISHDGPYTLTAEQLEYVK